MNDQPTPEEIKPSQNTNHDHGTPKAFHGSLCSGSRNSLENVSNKKFKKIQPPSDKGLLINIFAKEAKTKKS